jgi:hypothetical protein
MIADITLSWDLIANTFVGCVLALIVVAVILALMGRRP